MTDSIICFLTVRPNQLFYNFVKKLPNSDRIYICIDDNDYEIPKYDKKIKIIKVDNKICEANGFKGTLTSLSPKWKDRAAARDKALYYFSNSNIKYDNIWFIEEDVFIPSIHTITEIDKKYIDGDLLVSKNSVIHTDSSEWMWPRLKNEILLPYPHACAMICAIRCSKKILMNIKEYADKHHCLFTDEALFNTIALQNKLDIKVIKELSTIVWRRNWEKSDILQTHLYHPIKEISKQYQYREN